MSTFILSKITQAIVDERMDWGGKRRYQQTSYEDTATSQVRSNGSLGQDGGSWDKEKQKGSRDKYIGQRIKGLMIEGV